jgi:hypothetical protein
MDLRVWNLVSRERESCRCGLIFDELASYGFDRSTTTRCVVEDKNDAVVFLRGARSHDADTDMHGTTDARSAAG